jgi:hypothetical protein
MSIAYDYEIIRVDEAARCMEIVYSSAGRQTMHIGARLPYQGESVKAVVEAYAPVRFWQELESAVVVPEVGITGSVVLPSVNPTTLGAAKQAKEAEIASWRYQHETKGVEVNGVAIKTDRESQAMVSSAFSSLKEGMIPSVDWKSSNGSFVTLNLEQVSLIARAVAQHVQSSFTAEKNLADQVDAATTIEEVNSIVVPWPTEAQIPVVVI